MKELLTVRQVAELLQLHEATIRRYIRDDKLEAVRIGRRIRVPRAAVEEMMSPQMEEEFSSVEAAAMLREAAVAYRVGGATSVEELPPAFTRLSDELAGLEEQEDWLKVGAFVTELRAEREKLEWEETKARLLEEAHQMALDMAEWPREKVWDQFEKAMEAARQQMIENGTAFDGDWIGD